GGTPPPGPARRPQGQKAPAPSLGTHDVARATRDEDERAWFSADFVFTDREDERAVQHVERLLAVAMQMGDGPRTFASRELAQPEGALARGGCDQQPHRDGTEVVAL